jgi:hypothetical protein
MTSLTLYIKRTEDFRKWFAKIPDDQIDLDRVIEVSAKAEKQFKQWAKQMKANIRNYMGFDNDNEVSDATLWKDLDVKMESEEALKQLTDKTGKRWAVPINCGSIGCVMGWAEYSYFPQKKIRDDVETYFGTSEYRTEHASLFVERQDGEVEQKQEALRRLDMRIIELKALAGLL